MRAVEQDIEVWDTQRHVASMLHADELAGRALTVSSMSPTRNVARSRSIALRRVIEASRRQRVGQRDRHGLAPRPADEPAGVRPDLRVSGPCLRTMPNSFHRAPLPGGRPAGPWPAAAPCQLDHTVAAHGHTQGIVRDAVSDILKPGGRIVRGDAQASAEVLGQGTREVKLERDPGAGRPPRVNARRTRCLEFMDAPAQRH